jgi:periplasmic divalent cation tolerance protein
LPDSPALADHGQDAGAGETSLVMLYTTWPDPASARSAGDVLVREGLVACANILPGMVSVYVWQGTVQSADETVMLLKTDARRAEAAAGRIARLHPYEVPACIALPVAEAGTLAPFASWVRAAAPLRGPG